MIIGISMCPRDLSDPWTGFTQFTLLEEKPPNGYMWSGERLTRKQLTSRPDHLWPELWEKMGKNAKLKERQKWSHEKPQLDNARKLRGVYFIDPEDKEVKETIKNARKKLEIPVAPAMPCKNPKNNKNCGCGASNKTKSKLACIFGSQWIYKTAYGRIIADSSRRPCCRKRRQFTTAIIWFTNLFQAMKNSRSEGSSGQGMGKNWRKISAWNLTKVRSKKEVIDEARTTGAKVHFASLMDICHLKNAELEARHQKIFEVDLYSEVTLWKMIQESYAVTTEQGSSASQMTAAKIMDIISRLPGCDGQAADAVSAYTQVKMEDAHKLLKNSKIGVSQTFWIRLPRHKWPKSVRSSFGRTVMGKAIWENPITARMGEGFPIGNAHSYTVKKGLFLSVYVDDIKLAWKKTESWSVVESTQ